MPASERDLSAVKHISQYCSDIHQLLEEIDYDRVKYDSGNAYRYAMSLCILQIGELVGLLSDEYKSNHPEIAWRDIKQMRNVVAHKYGNFDYDILWEVVTEGIPELRAFCEKAQ